MTPVPVTIPQWSPPWPTDDVASFVRVSAAHLHDDSPWLCPQQIAAKARPQIQPVRDPAVRREYAPDASFPLGTIHDALHASLARNQPIDSAISLACDESKATITEPYLAVVNAGVAGYLQVIDQLRDADQFPASTAVRDFIGQGVDTDGAAVEWYGWGILHVSTDSLIREYHLLTYYGAGQRERSLASLGVYARIAADPVAVVPGGSWRSPFTAAPAQPRPGETVIIREIGVLDSTDSVLFTGTTEQARELFATEVPPALSVLAGDFYRPTGGCAGCTVRSACTGVTRIPGLLGVIGATTWPRTFSCSDLTHARACTYRIYLQRTLGLPAAPSLTTPAMTRGTNVHRWLEFAHGQRRRCIAAELPEDQVDPVGEQLGWTLDEYRALRPYLLAHAMVCPILEDGDNTTEPEITMTGWDTDVDITMSTRADLVYETDGWVVVRETKTTARLFDTGSQLQMLRQYPQVALSLCMLADGLHPLQPQRLPRTPLQARVELEILTLEGSQVLSFDATDPDVVLLARTCLAEAIDPLLYTAPTPQVGDGCSICPVSAWCDAFQTHAAAPAHETPSGSLAIFETASANDDDIPF